jgi:type IV pilus assembly protein PilW
MEKSRTRNNSGLPAFGASGLSARSMAGFTIIELLVAIALGMVILAGLFRTFKVQQDSYVIQDQVSAMQQNLRAAMYMITRDLQMAGYYTNFDRNNRQMDWNDLDGDSDPTNNMETGRPLIFAVNNAAGVRINVFTDLIVIVKASRDEGRYLHSGEGASASSISLSSWNLDSESGDDLNTAGKKYGVLVKNDLSYAELFHLDNSGNITPPLTENYTVDDRIHRADIIIYKVDDSTPTRPCLVRKNLGNDSGYQVIAENIDNLQFRYLLDDGTPNGTWTNAPVGNDQHRVRAVEVFLIGRTAFPQRGYIDTSTYTFGTGGTPESYTPPVNDRPYRRRTLTSIIKTRNIGL